MSWNLLWNIQVYNWLNALLVTHWEKGSVSFAWCRNVRMFTLVHIFIGCHSRPLCSFVSFLCHVFVFAWYPRRCCTATCSYLSMPRHCGNTIHKFCAEQNISVVKHSILERHDNELKGKDSQDKIYVKYKISLKCTMQLNVRDRSLFYFIQVSHSVN